MIDTVHRYIREHGLIVPGDRVCVAVSGGADSVALLRVLLELRQELGVVLAVAHFNHEIRGEEADADQRFVADLARKSDLEFHSAAGHTPDHARQHKISLETAARDLRHAWFGQLVREGKVDKIATGHTQDDQAETVLMRILRGTGTRGLAGISPWHKQKALIRPLLAITRQEIEEYLTRLGQRWRDDSTNKDLHYARNRVRHELLPALKRDYNPAIRQLLSDLAEVAQAEEDYWKDEVAQLATRMVRSGKPSRSGRSNREQATLALDSAALASLPLAVQRRLVRLMAEKLGATLEFKHVQELLTFALQKLSGKELQLSGGLVARKTLRELQMSLAKTPETRDYSYSLEVPGQVTVAELGTTIRTAVLRLNGPEELSRYNSGLLDRALLKSELTVRNWRAGDRFFPAHTRSPRKVKELLQPGRLGHELSAGERKAWPVIVSGNQIVWLRGFPVPQAFAAKSGEAVLIEELRVT